MFITVTGLSKRFESPGSRRRGAGRTFHDALREVSLTVDQGELITLVGPSGSGKTSLLRCLAGLEVPTGGEITMNDRTVYSSAAGVNVPTHQRNVGMVFQSYALWPHLTVRQNVQYPLKRQKVPAAAQRERVERYLDVVECAALADRYPHQLSGGQQQRVALARALVYEPKVVLFDEPLSNLDAGLREQLRYEIRRIQQALGFTGVYVTHDRREAFAIGDRCAVLLGGRLLQYGTPAELYAAPADADVAAFLGATNVLDGVLRRDDGAWRFESGVTSLALDGAALNGFAPDAPVSLRTRADALRVEPAGGARGVPGSVVDRMVVENHVEYLVDVGAAQPWRVRMPTDGGRFDRQDFDRQDKVEVVVPPDRMLFYPVRP